MDNAPARRRMTLVGGVGQTNGNEFVDADGNWHYINHQPHFSVHHFPTKDPEEVWYREWENEVILYGWHLRHHYDNLKANAPDTIEVSKHPYDPAQPNPYIQDLRHRLRL